MKGKFPVFAVAIVAVVATAMGGAATAASREPKLTPRDMGTETTAANVINSMKRANGTRFVATYRLHGYLYFPNGTIVIAQIPSPPGTKATTNVDGYSGTGRYAYVLRGLTGRIIQWIKIGTNVSACANVPVTGNYQTGTFGKLRCSRPSPYIPSNGFAQQDVGFVPAYVLQQVTEFDGFPSQKRAVITTRSSRRFGPVRCLVQYSGPTTQTTCIDRAGFIVSWLDQSGTGYSSSATLTSINHRPVAADFTTLLRPTTSLILPAA